MILSERLELRELTVADAPFIVELLNDPDFHRYIGDRGIRTLDDAEVGTSSFVMGGARQLSGFRQNSVSGQNISLMRAVYYRRLTPRSYLPLDFPLYLGASVERGRAWNNDNEFDSGYINAASIFLGLETPLGPLNFTYGLNDANEQAVYLNLGQTF